MAEPAPNAQEAKPAGASALLANRYLIHPHQPLADLSTPCAQAFKAEDRRDPARQIFGLVCRPDLPPRANVMRALKGVQTAGVMQMVEWGPAHWPPSDRQCMLVVYERPAGGRVMSSLTAEFRRFDEIELIRKVVTPLAAGLKELKERGVTHRAIRPTNMFFMAGARDGLVLGDCVTSPPAFDQPALFETIECAMAHHAARGSGHYSHDLYALGVSLVMLALGRNPVSRLSDDEILSQKIAQGSYSTLVGDERLPISMIEVLRGLLCDDEEERWTLESLDLWLNGRRLSPIQPKLPKRSQRTFAFRGREYTNARELAIALARHWDEAVPAVLDGKLELWLRRALEDKEKADRVAGAVRNVTGSISDKKTAADVMLAKVCMILDPEAPIRYKGFHAMPDGFGPALALMMAEQSDTRLFAECLQRDIPKLWFSERETYSPEYSLLEGSFRELRDILKLPTFGGGLERCLYELNEALPCQSPLIAQDYVVDIRELMPAMERASKRTDHRTWPFDRHIVAFLATRLNYDITKQLQALNDPDPAMSTLGMLNLMAILQWRLGPPELLGLTNWVGSHLGPVISSYHNRDRRKVLEKEIPRLVRSGNLLELYKLVDDPEERQKDADGFAWAKAEWAAAEQEIAELEAGRGARDDQAVRTGQQTAALTSVIVALLTLTILAILQVW